MTVSGEGREPGRAHGLELGARHGVRKREAAAILDEVGAAVSRFRELAKEAGCRAATVHRIARALRPELSRDHG